MLLVLLTSISEDKEEQKLCNKYKKTKLFLIGKHFSRNFWKLSLFAANRGNFSMSLKFLESMEILLKFHQFCGKIMIFLILWRRM